MPPSADKPELSPEEKAAYGRLGRLLRERRVSLNLRYRQRTVFERERAAGINPKMLQDIENGTRGGYSNDNKTAIEKAYELAPGSIDRAFKGGDLEPLSATGLTPEELGAKFIEFLEWDRARREGRGERSA